MSFNHYAKLKRILEDTQPGWCILRIDKPTKAKNFKNETVYFDHYYRIYSKDGEPIKYCKFQQIDRLAQILNVPLAKLPVKPGKN